MARDTSLFLLGFVRDEQFITVIVCMYNSGFVPQMNDIEFQNITLSKSTLSQGLCEH